MLPGGPEGGLGEWRGKGKIFDGDVEETEETTGGWREG
jgi:hypothetical protein